MFACRTGKSAAAKAASSHKKEMTIKIKTQTVKKDEKVQHVQKEQKVQTKQKVQKTTTQTVQNKSNVQNVQKKQPAQKKPNVQNAPTKQSPMKNHATVKPKNNAKQLAMKSPMKTMAMKAPMKTMKKTGKTRRMTRGEAITARNLAWETELNENRLPRIQADTPMRCLICDDPIPGRDLRKCLRQWAPGIAAAVCYDCEAGTASEVDA